MIRASAFQFVIASLLVALAGCSGKKAPALPSSGSDASVTSEAAAAQAPAVVSNVPLKLEVAQEFVENGELNVKLLVEPLVSLRSSQVLLRIKGLKDGNVIEKKEQVLSESAAKEIVSPGEKYSMRFQLRADGLSEYQIECSWGDDARGAGLAKMADVPPVPTHPGVELVQVVLESSDTACDKPPCDKMFTLTGNLENGDDVSIGRVQLALGVFWVEKDGAEPPFPAALSELDLNEEKIELNGLEVPAHSTKKVRVNLDRALPQLDTGGFVPHLRLLSFEKSQ